MKTNRKAVLLAAFLSVGTALSHPAAAEDFLQDNCDIADNPARCLAARQLQSDRNVILTYQGIAAAYGIIGKAPGNDSPNSPIPHLSPDLVAPLSPLLGLLNAIPGMGRQSCLDSYNHLTEQSKTGSDPQIKTYAQQLLGDLKVKSAEEACPTLPGSEKKAPEKPKAREWSA